jgi:DNA-binding FadR family transcriptional regulator
VEIRDRSRKLVLEVFSVSSVFEDVLPLKRVDLPRTRELICEIEELLVEKGIKPGVRLGSKEELCRCFMVSPGTLNEALRVLETRGILELRRGSKGGVFAAAVSMQPFLDQVPFGAKRDAVAIEQCLVVLTQLEPLVAIEAAKSAQREAIAELYYLVEQMASVDPRRWLKRRCLFQLRLAQLGSNAVLTGVYTMLLRSLEEHFASVVPVHDHSRYQRANLAHRVLVAAIASGNAQQAAAASHACEWPISCSSLRRERLKPSVRLDALSANDTQGLLRRNAGDTPAERLQFKTTLSN